MHKIKYRLKKGLACVAGVTKMQIWKTIATLAKLRAYEKVMTPLRCQIIENTSSDCKII